MCGIGGMLGEPDAAVLKRMISLMNHRGPDGSGVFEDDNCGLAHSRLSIVDLAGGVQPLYSDSSCVAVVNGEIYNHKDLKITSYNYRTNSDSEAVLAMHSNSKSNHAEWVSKLDGMFAFALWDPIHGELILARDQMGIKPLVRTVVDGTLLFASEFKALRAHESHVPEIDEFAMKARIAWEYPLDGTTLLKDVHQVRPGTIEVWKLVDGSPVRTSVQTFGTPLLQPNQDWDNPEVLLESFISSVSDRLMSEVPVGIVLSGGLDSSLVAAVANQAAERAEQPVPACWTVSESEDNPDWIAAENVAKSLDLEHNQYILEPSAFENRLPDLCWHGEDLDVTVLFFQPLFEKMSESVTVGLCGQGADELHAGYPRYRDTLKHAELVKSRLENMSCNLGNLNGEQWWSDDHNPDSHCTSLDNMLDFELNHGQLSNFQLRLVDRHSMAHSLEVRVPFLGSAHRKAVSELPLSQKLPSDNIEKKALRSAAALTSLPKEIVHRPKLPAGRATSPKMIDDLVNELLPRAKELISVRPQYDFSDQPEIAIGLGLFEAMHIIDGGRTKKIGTAAELLDEVIC